MTGKPKKIILIIGAIVLVSLPLAVSAQKCSFDSGGPKEVPGVFATISVTGGSVKYLKGRVKDVNGGSAAAPVWPSSGSIPKGTTRVFSSATRRQTRTGLIASARSPAAVTFSAPAQTVSSGPR